jgi:hypothetical protein
MTRRASPPSPIRLGFSLLLLIGVGGGLGLLLMRDGGREIPQSPPSDESSRQPSGPADSASRTSRSTRAPRMRIPENGRLQVSRDVLREGDVLALGLDLPDEARGTQPLPLKLVDVRGRMLELDAVPVEGPGNGLRIEIDPAWLDPGRYLIQVETAETHPLALRRYVLEVSDSIP